MTTLSQAHRQLLVAVAGGDGTDDPAIHPRTAAALVKRGLLGEGPGGDGRRRFLITKAGRAAIGTPGEAAISVAATLPEPKSPGGKLGVLIGLLDRPQGAMIDELMAATGWQAHSVRGAIAGSLKKRQGLDITSEKSEAGRVYRIDRAIA